MPSKSNKILINTVKKFSKTGKFLDLGCGLGQDVIFMCEKDWEVVGVDKNKEFIDNIKNKLLANSDQVKLVVSDIRNYDIKKENFDIINCRNALQFLSKDEAIELINCIKLGVRPGGYILITGFTDQDPLYKKGRGFFGQDEIKKYFKDMEIEIYKEEEIQDKAHPGYSKPHKHFVYRLVVRK